LPLPDCSFCERLVTLEEDCERRKRTGGLKRSRQVETIAVKCTAFLLVHSQHARAFLYYGSLQAALCTNAVDWVQFNEVRWHHAHLYSMIFRNRHKGLEKAWHMPKIDLHALNTYVLEYLCHVATAVLSELGGT
jgi:hypothetical protein